MFKIRKNPKFFFIFYFLFYNAGTLVSYEKVLCIRLMCHISVNLAENGISRAHPAHSAPVTMG